MMVRLEMGSGFEQVVRELGAMSADFILAVSRGLGKGAEHTIHHIVENYLTGQSLKRRSSMLARNVAWWMDEPLEAILGVPDGSPVDEYKWILGDESLTITPKKASALTIPIGDALTSAGVARYDSVRQAEQQLGTSIFRPKGTNVLGYKRGKKGKFRPLFVLVQSVFVQGSRALSDGVLDSLDVFVENIEDEISEKI